MSTLGIATLKTAVDQTGLKSGLKTARATTTSEFKKAAGDVSSGLLGVNLASLSVVGAIAGVVLGVGKATGELITYNKSILDASRATRMSVDEFSRFVQVGDDVGVSMGSITQALQLATKNGFAPSIGSLAALADKANAMASPTERAAFLAKILGRNWAALDPIFQLGGKRIMEMSAAQAAGLVATEASIAKTEAMRMKLDELNDGWVAFRNTFVLAVVPPVVQGLEVVYQYLVKWASVMTFGLIPTEVEATKATDAWRQGMIKAAGQLALTQTATEGMTQASYYQAAAEAFIAGDMRAYRHFRALGDAAGYAAGQMKTLLENMQAVFENATGWSGMPTQYGQGPANQGSDPTKKSLMPWATSADKAYAAAHPDEYNVGGQHGLHTIVPPGFPSDSFRLGATSGEEVLIRTKEQQAGGAGGGVVIQGLVINDRMEAQAFKQRFYDVLRG